MTGHVDVEALASTLRGLATRSAELDATAALQSVVSAPVALFGVDGGGLMLLDGQGDLRVTVASSEAGQTLERLQTEAGQGPCLDAYVEDVVVVVQDLGSDERWPRCARLVRSLPIGGVLGVPIHVAGMTVGSLNVHVTRPYRFDETEIEALTRYGEVVEAILETSANASAADQVAGQLRTALEYRVPIERGVGFLMARDRLDATGAFAVLRSASRSTRTRIGDVATQLLRTGLLPDEAKGRGR